MDHIVFYRNNLSQYGVLQYFSKEFAKALERKGIRISFMSIENFDAKNYVFQMLKDPPDLTFGFNGPLPNSKGQSMSDLTHIPHVSALVDSIHLFYDMVKSPESIILCPDQYSNSFLTKTGFKKHFFFPHAVSKTLFEKPLLKDRPYDIVFLGSYMDHLSYKDKWHASYGEILANVLDKAALESFANPETPYQEILIYTLNQAQKSTSLAYREIDLFALTAELEMYIRGKDRIELIKGIKAGKVHVFGSGNWADALKGSPNIEIHEPVDYLKSFEIMSQSKIVLNSSPMFRFGAHERIFTSLALGAACITNFNSYLASQFDPGRELGFFKNPNEANEIAAYLLANPDKRDEIALAGRKKTALHHTWDNRAEEFLEKIPPFLEEYEN